MHKEGKKNSSLTLNAQDSVDIVHNCNQTSDGLVGGKKRWGERGRRDETGYNPHCIERSHKAVRKGADHQSGPTPLSHSDTTREAEQQEAEVEG